MSAISNMLLVYKKSNEINIVYLDPDWSRNIFIYSLYMYLQDTLYSLLEDILSLYESLRDMKS